MDFLRIVNSYERLNDSSLIGECRAIVQAMKDNAHFPDPDPALAVLTAAANRFTHTIVSTSAHSVDRKQARQALLDNLHLESYYVLYQSKGDPAVVASAGFNVAKRSGTPRSVQVPQLVKAGDTGNPGELLITFKAQRAARSYLVLYGINPQSEADYKTVSCTSSKAVLRRLESGQRYTIKVVVIGPRGQRAESQIITRVVQ